MIWKSLSPGRDLISSLSASRARPDPRDRPGRHGAPRRAIRPICHRLSILVGLLTAAPLHAAMVGTDLPYQTYRDFAENKGVFRPGARNISLYDKAGAPYAVLDRAPMIDFRVADTTGIATLVAPQYVVSVKHNGGYTGVTFGYRGDTRYTLVNRNNHRWEDFHSPRLNKIVTEVAPIAMTDAGDAAGTYADLSRFPVFYRVGSGVQRVRDRAGVRTRIAGGYAYLTGGTVGSPEDSYWFLQALPGATYSPKQGPMASYGGPGDSGSPLFAWDTRRGQWILVAVQTGWSGEGATLSAFDVIPLPDVMDVIDGKTDAPVITHQSDGEIHWTYDGTTGTGALNQAQASWTMHGRFGPNQAAALDHGKDLTFRGDALVVLESTVDQGAGALTFDGRYTVMPKDTQTWRGGGITVNAESFVDWQVNGVAADSLHKLGAGTLQISASGVNPGALNIGDGTVILAQRADAANRVQAFAAARIVSGRPTLVLADSRQIDPDNIQWGFRGGTLDINGNDVTFHRLNGADAGAVLTNSSSPATVNLAFAAPGGVNATTLWHGHFTGNVNIANTATPQSRFAIDGGIDSSGTFIQKNGLLYLQGHPVVHAANAAAVVDMLKSLGDDSLPTRPVSFTQPDWETRHFRMAALELRDAQLHLGRNAALATDIHADHSFVTLGSSSVFIDLNDGTDINTAPSAGESRAGTDVDTSKFEGGVTLANDSTLYIMERFNGGIDSTDSETHVSSAHALLDRPSVFTHSLLNLRDDARLTGRAGLASDGEVRVGANAILSMLAAADRTLPVTTYSAASWILNGQDAVLEAGPGTRLTGNILSDQAAQVRLGGGESGGLTAPRAADLGNSDAPETVYAGSVNAAQASMRIQETAHWIVTGDSTLKQLQASQALLSFDDMTQTRNGFMARAQSGPDMPGNLSPTAAILPAYTLTADTVAATDSTFALRVDPNGGDHDRLTITTGLSGSGNRLRITEFGDRPASAVPVAREDLLLSAPASAPADLFQLEQAYTDGAADTSSGGNPWLGGLAVSQDAGQRQWWFVSMRDDAPWRLSQDRQFDSLHLPTGGRVELSQPQAADWTPRTLQTGTLNASGVHFALTARPQEGASDSIRVATEALGDDNSLDLTLLVRGEVPDNASGRLLLASAPVSTADSYFKTGSVTQGLTVYVPNLEIVSTDTEKKWQLAYRAVERPADPPVEKPAEPPVEKPAETPEIETPQGGGASPGDAPALDGDPGPATNPGATDTPQTGDSSGSPEAPGDTAATEPAPPPADDPVLVVTPDAGGGAQTRPGLSLFTAVSLKLSELDALGSREEIVKRLGQAGVAADEGTIRKITEVRRQIARTGSLASLPRVSFVLETNQLDKRLGDVRQLNEDAGLWIKTSHGRADYQQIGLKHTTLQFGLDRKQGRQLYGIMGSYTQGSGQGDGALSERHTTGGIGLYYALIHEDGPFVDVIAKYLKTNQTYQFPSQLNIAAQGARSTSLLASVQAGWRLNLLNGGAFIEPSAEVVAGATSGYTLHGGKDSVDVRVNASRPVYAKIGAAVGLNLQSDAQHALAVSAGLFRLQNLRRGGSIDIVNNGSPDDVLRNPMADDSRYLVNLSLNARLSANWRLYSQVESSFAGKLKHDYSGQIGVRYQF
ncbi:S6 family peptidase [Achromobacter ruhlandii]|uniref:S6 family peptidase n=3 Tax=Achromobacter ruhlandii TaxID=72557 RepID=UPI0021F0FA28|nr:S6 family peptidase [Achromobacter ruhlandii]MCV6804061.1 autotransporter outer membrane beta-barrel domain-containing protein [Achromobacter ruhlandii]